MKYICPILHQLCRAFWRIKLCIMKIVLITVLAILALSSCQPSRTKLLDNAAAAYCNCSAASADILIRMDTASHSTKMQMMKEIDTAVEAVGNCLENDKALKRYRQYRDKLVRTEQLRLDEELAAKEMSICPEVKKLTTKP